MRIDQCYHVIISKPTSSTDHQIQTECLTELQSEYLQNNHSYPRPDVRDKPNPKQTLLCRAKWCALKRSLKI